MRASPTPAPIVDAVWRALRDGAGPAQPNRVAVFADRFCHDDLVPRHALSDLVEDLGLDSLAYAPGFDDLLQAFDIPTTTGFNRPSRRVRRVMGTAYVSLADAAELLIMLERCGLPVDPALLVAAIRPSLMSKPLLTGAELRCWWFDQERHRSEGMTLSAADMAFKTTQEVRTPAGYRAEAWLDADGKAVSLWVRSPRYRHRRTAR